MNHRITRRQMLLAGVGLFVTGCGTAATVGGRPGAPWPSQVTEPQRADQNTRTTRAPRRSKQPANLDVIARQRWASRGAVPGRVNRMGQINRITVHHEGWTSVWFTDYRRTARRIEHDRHVHVDDRGWGDLGYHYIIDRAGRLWEGRDLDYQGAHVKDHNRHNIGVMCLGNFDKQQPSEAQLRTLISTLKTLRQTYNVPVSRIHTHQELNPTACPGANLQPRMVAIRQNGHLT